jgi:hypothetical protein
VLSAFDACGATVNKAAAPNKAPPAAWSMSARDKDSEDEEAFIVIVYKEVSER